MKKNTKEVAVEEIVKEVSVVKKPVIDRIGLQFNQEDVNRLRDKVNELVDRLNQ